jgi:sugar lactone lactonase YvrE
VRGAGARPAFIAGLSSGRVSAKLGAMQREPSHPVVAGLLIAGITITGALLSGAGCARSSGPAPDVPAPEPAAQPEPQGTARLEVVAALDQGPGNITVTPSGQIILSLHQFFEPAMPVALLGAGGALSEVAAGAGLRSVLGVQADRDDVVWLLDNGMRGGVPPRLIGWEMAESRLVADIDLAPVTPDDAFVNDLVVDKDHGAIYIADPAGGANAAILVVDLGTGQARRVLEGHASVVPEDVDLIIDGTPVRVRTPDGQEIRPRVGINPIAADAANEWLYYGPMHGHGMYRVRTADLRDASLSPEALASRVERWADKPICDGITLDDEGNIYLGDLASNAIGVIDTERRYRVLVADPRLSWVDAFSFGPDGALYTVANQLHRSATLNAGTQTATPPYHVLRVQPLAPGVTGR